LAARINLVERQPEWLDKAGPCYDDGRAAAGAQGGRLDGWAALI
jgi:hypothetical protein